jgi:hypothetical protein
VAGIAAPPTWGRPRSGSINGRGRPATGLNRGLGFVHRVGASGRGTNTPRCRVHLADEEARDRGSQVAEDADRVDAQQPADDPPPRRHRIQPAIHRCDERGRPPERLAERRQRAAGGAAFQHERHPGPDNDCQEGQQREVERRATAEDLLERPERPVEPDDQLPDVHRLERRQGVERVQRPQEGQGQRQNQRPVGPDPRQSGRGDEQPEQEVGDEDPVDAVVGPLHRRPFARGHRRLEQDERDQDEENEAQTTIGGSRIASIRASSSSRSACTLAGPMGAAPAPPPAAVAPAPVPCRPLPSRVVGPDRPRRGQASLQSASGRRDSGGGARREDRWMASGRGFGDDLYLLAGLLGRVLRAQAGEAAFALEEEVRALAKASRAGTPGAADELQEAVANLTTADAETLVGPSPSTSSLSTSARTTSGSAASGGARSKPARRGAGPCGMRSGSWPSAGSTPPPSPSSWGGPRCGRC